MFDFRNAVFVRNSGIYYCRITLIDYRDGGARDGIAFFVYDINSA